VQEAVFSTRAVQHRRGKYPAEGDIHQMEQLQATAWTSAATTDEHVYPLFAPAKFLVFYLLP